MVADNVCLPGATAQTVPQWRSTVGVFTSPSDRHDGDKLFFVVDVVDHTPIADTDAPALQPTQSSAPRAARIFFQLKDGYGNAAKIRLVDAVQLAPCLATEQLNSVLGWHGRLRVGVDTRVRPGAGRW